jgi:RHH-type proline utilization regulon transcriptional repressor/proline dehydrogenase/delta 1-pyrroline-5-carboxylate dehydrogenase
MHSDTLNTARRAINQAYLANEASTVQHLLLQLTDYPADAVSRSAQALLEKIRYKPHQARQSLTQAFLTEYQLNSDEGIALMTIEITVTVY